MLFRWCRTPVKGHDMYIPTLREKRFQRNARMKQRRRTQAMNAWPYHHDEAVLQRDTGMRYHTPAMCSCPMCGNPRKHFHTRSIQELRWMQRED